jgi:hypothetical protein
METKDNRKAFPFSDSVQAKSYTIRHELDKRKPPITKLPRHTAGQAVKKE